MPSSGRRRQWGTFIALALTCLVGCRAVEDRRRTRRENAAAELTKLSAPVLPLYAPLTLDEAIQRALAHNLDYQLLRLDRDLREEEASGARFKMLPNLIVSAEANYRSRVRAVRSKILDADTGGTFPAYAYSAPKDNVLADMQLAWNLLDFGISYFRSRQAENQILIAEQQARRAGQNLALDVTLTYYRAVAADRAADQARDMLGRIQKHQQVIRRQIDGKVLGEIKGLDSEEALVLMRMKLQDFETEHRSAKSELASLIGLAPGSEMEFAPVDFEILPQQITLDVHALEQEALENRPELYEQDLQEKVMLDEVNAAIVDLFPSPVASLGLEHDSNRYLKYHTWHTAGLRASWNLLALPQRMSRVKQAKLKVEMVKERRIALACGVLAQTHLAVIACEDDLHQFELARGLNQIRQRKLAAALKHLQQGQIDAAEVMRLEGEALFARIRYMLAHADVATSVRRLANAIGRGLGVAEGSLRHVPADRTQVRRPPHPSAVVAAPVHVTPPQQPPVTVHVTPRQPAPIAVNENPALVRDRTRVRRRVVPARSTQQPAARPPAAKTTPVAPTVGPRRSVSAGSSQQPDARPSAPKTTPVTPTVGPRSPVRRSKSKYQSIWGAE